MANKYRGKVIGITNHQRNANQKHSVINTLNVYNFATNIKVGEKDKVLGNCEELIDFFHQRFVEENFKNN
jgi:hypothetical protein